MSPIRYVPGEERKCSKCGASHTRLHPWCTACGREYQRQRFTEMRAALRQVQNVHRETSLADNNEQLSTHISRKVDNTCTDDMERRAAAIQEWVNKHSPQILTADVPRCERCNWPLAKRVNDGCVPGNCAWRSK